MKNKWSNSPGTRLCYTHVAVVSHGTNVTSLRKQAGINLPMCVQVPHKSQEQAGINLTRVQDAITRVYKVINCQESSWQMLQRWLVLWNTAPHFQIHQATQVNTTTPLRFATKNSAVSKNKE